MMSSSTTSVLCRDETLSFALVNCSAADSRGRIAFRTRSRLDPPLLRTDIAVAVMMVPPNSSIESKLVSLLPVYYVPVQLYNRDII